MKSFNVEYPIIIDDYWPEELASIVGYRTNEPITVEENKGKRLDLLHFLGKNKTCL